MSEYNQLVQPEPDLPVSTEMLNTDYVRKVKKNGDLSELISYEDFRDPIETAVSEDAAAAHDSMVAAGISETNAAQSESDTLALKNTVQGLHDTVVEDAAQVALDRIATGEDAAQTELDRIATGQDAQTATTKAGEASDSAAAANTSKNYASGYADDALESKNAAKVSEDNASASAAIAQANSVYNGGLAYTASAPTPAKNCYYEFISAGTKPAWLTGGVSNVAIGDRAIVIYTAPSTYTYTYMPNPNGNVSQKAGARTNYVLSEKATTDLVQSLKIDYSSSDYTAGKIWAGTVGNAVTMNTSSYGVNCAVAEFNVLSGQVLVVSTSVSGTANKVLLADSNGLVVALYPYNSDVSFITIPVGVTKVYVNRRSDLTFSCIKLYTITELPIYAPSPQLPANISAGSDFDAETMTTVELYAAFDSLIASASAPYSKIRNNPKNITKYEIVGMDSTNALDINAYVIGKRNRYAWLSAEKLYAWKNPSNVVFYINSCSPKVGDIIYSDSARTNSGLTVAAFNSTLQQFTDSASAVYTVSSADNIDAVVIYTLLNPLLSGASTTLAAYNRADASLGNATVSDLTHITLSAVAYTRAPSLDYHTAQKATIVLWGNEHGPTSDPAEPAIILYRLSKDLVGGCRNNEFLQYIKNYCKVIVIPCLNPYGLNNHTRNNGNNVNINRNYNTVGWAVQSDTDKGTYAGSESETQYAMNIVKKFSANVAIDIHCLGYNTSANEGTCHYSGLVSNTSLNNNIFEAMLSFGYDYTWYGGDDPADSAQGGAWLRSISVNGGLLEMSAGAYAVSYDGKQHTGIIMDMDYTLLLGAIRMWHYGYDATIDFTKLSIR